MVENLNKTQTCNSKNKANQNHVLKITLPMDGWMEHKVHSNNLVNIKHMKEVGKGSLE